MEGPGWSDLNASTSADSALRTIGSAPTVWGWQVLKLPGMELLPETLTLNSLFGMSTSINLSSNFLEAAKLAAEKSDLRQVLGRSGESAGSNAAGELPAFDCGGPPLVDLDDKGAYWI